MLLLLTKAAAIAVAMAMAVLQLCLWAWHCGCTLRLVTYVTKLNVLNHTASKTATLQLTLLTMYLHHPMQAVVDVSVLVVEAGGSELAAAITAASVALADAGLELHDLLPACDMVRRACA